MYLKSIEVHGFKSFANKIVFKFHDGITAIVGPNGSGKSNVADAVRWVLGEQSAKQLRGSKMEDVIFAGTQMRKPMGYAYVAITLDNSDHKLPIDYEEVVVARRVYRSGESEYLINNNTCRLRDVQELFLDTGIGKEGYSIIGQGQIDKILSGKPEDRRELFDEAAGIVKYKKRKAAAEKELAEEQLNLSRITDILSEIEKQVGPLQKQSEVAREYLRLKEALKNLEINLFLMEYERSEKNKAELDGRIQIVSDELERANQAYDNTKQEYERLEAELEQFSAEIDRKKEQRTQFLMMVQEKEGEIRLMQEKISSIQISDSHFKQRYDALLAETQAKEEELSRYDKDYEAAETELKKISKQQEAKEAELEQIRERISAYARKIEECNQLILSSMDQNAEIRTSLQRFETLEEQTTLKKAELTQKILLHKSEEAGYQEEVTKCSEALENVTLKITEKKHSIEEQEGNITKIRQMASELAAKIEQAERKRIEEASKLEALRNLTERYDGYGNAIRKVMERKQDTPGVIGVVADIIKVDSKYETAMETALGASIQNIVTKDEATAKKMVEYLKANKFGRATFLPLTSITIKALGQNQDQAAKENGVIGYANTLVHVAKEYEELMKYLLGRVLVVDTMEHALELARKYHYTLRIVTLEGEQLNPGGSISGGAYKNNSNLLGRRREMEDGEKKIEELKLQVAEFAKEREGLQKQREAASQNLLTEREELQALFLEQNTAKINLTQANDRLNALKAEYASIEEEVALLESKNRDHVTGAEQLKNRLKENQNAIKEAQKTISDATLHMAADKEEEQNLSEENSKLLLERAGQEKNLQFVQQNKYRLLGELHRLGRELEELKNENNSTQERIEEQEQGIATARENIATWQDTIAELEKNLEELEEKKEEINKGHKNFFAKREELSKQISELDKESFRLANQVERLQEAMNNQADYMWNEYEITVDLAKKFKDDTLPSYTAVKKEISELRSGIKALGDVNVNAIEDYRNLSERYELYNNQRNDLVEAEEALMKIIEQLDSEMRKQFEEKFLAIKEQFDVVFRELFGGGKGTLELMEDEDVLTAGIRINAQPPGKKLQNMMQLSGGEKALTAIALLFAIQNLKPSPFCLLDEIEAALDDSNVGRYAKYLHKLTQNTQFIVITHRRGTMAASDILYGITMQEKGVSTLVSVNLIEDDLDQ
ncbi:MAG: chromosome segregation protein SMC [Lachnospiraceae bacterium]|nr:chromosome segregation protein SMC [Lachnospiraceae bacterium]